MALQSGHVNMGFGYFDTKDEDWNMLGTTGVRQYIRDVSFHTEFSEIPEVVVMLKGFQSEQGEDPSVALGINSFLVGASSVAPNGFNLSLSVWGDTSLTGVSVHWFAYDSGERQGI